MQKAILLIATALLIASCGTSKKKVETRPVAETPDDGITNVIPMEVTIDIPEVEEENTVEMETEVDDEMESETEEMETSTEASKSVDHTPWNSLLKQNVTAVGNVNYEGFRKNRSLLLAYIDMLGKNLPSDSWTKEEKLAYWMNAYNAMTVDLILRNQPLKSIKDIKDPWEQRYWKLGAKYYNLDEIEHQILRKMEDPRIHFGINCASFSCPPLLNIAFTSEKVNDQLDFLARRFINDPTRNTITADSVEISKIFDWFSKDFKQNGSVIDYLNTYSETKINNNTRIRYKDYDWILNK